MGVKDVIKLMFEVAGIEGDETFIYMYEKGISKFLGVVGEELVRKVLEVFKKVVGVINEVREGAAVGIEITGSSEGQAPLTNALTEYSSNSKYIDQAVHVFIKSGEDRRVAFRFSQKIELGVVGSFSLSLTIYKVGAGGKSDVEYEVLVDEHDFSEVGAKPKNLGELVKKLEEECEFIKTLEFVGDELQKLKDDIKKVAGLAHVPTPLPVSVFFSDDSFISFDHLLQRFSIYLHATTIREAKEEMEKFKKVAKQLPSAYSPIIESLERLARATELCTRTSRGKFMKKYAGEVDGVNYRLELSGNEEAGKIVAEVYAKIGDWEAEFSDSAELIVITSTELTKLAEKLNKLLKVDEAREDFSKCILLELYP